MLRQWRDARGFPRDKIVKFKKRLRNLSDLIDVIVSYLILFQSSLSRKLQLYFSAPSRNSCFISYKLTVNYSQKNILLVLQTFFLNSQNKKNKYEFI